MSEFFVQHDPALRRRQMLAQAMIERGNQSGPVSHWTQGASRIANSLAGSYFGKKAADEESMRREKAMQKLTAALSGQPGREELEGGSGMTVDLGRSGDRTNDLVQALAGINPQMALSVKLSQDQQRRAAMSQDRALADQKDLYKWKRQTDQKYPKPESEFDRYMKMVQLEKAEEQRKKLANENRQTENAQDTEQYNVQTAADQLAQLVQSEGFGNIYGGFQGVLPSVRGSSVDAEARRDQVIDLLSLMARGQLKGQGQITEGEQSMLRNAQTMMENPRISDEAAMQEAGRVMNYLASEGAQIDPGVMALFAGEAATGGDRSARREGSNTGQVTIRRID